MDKILEEIIAVTLRNHGEVMIPWNAKALAHLLAVEQRRRERDRWNALPWWHKAWRRLTGRGFR